MNLQNMVGVHVDWRITFGTETADCLKKSGYTHVVFNLPFGQVLTEIDCAAELAQRLDTDVADSSTKLLHEIAKVVGLAPGARFSTDLLPLLHGLVARAQPPDGVNAKLGKVSALLEQVVDQALAANDHNRQHLQGFLVDNKLLQDARVALRSNVM